MITRILIPKGLQVVVIDDNSETEIGINVKLRNRRKTGKSLKIVSAEEEHDEKPSSSSGHFETGSDPVEVDDDHDQIKEYRSISSTSTSSSSSSSDSQGSSSSSPSESEGESEPISSRNSPRSENIIGSSETTISKSKIKKKRRREKRNGRRESKGSKESKLFREKEKNNEEVPSKVKICTTRLIEKGTVFTANDGDVQVVQLKGVPAIPRDDVRFMFGCFETIAPSTPLTPTSPPGIASAATTTTTPETDESFIRLCNWVRFLPSVKKASSSPTPSTERRRSSISNNSSELDITDEKKCSHADYDQESNSSSDNSNNQASWNPKKLSRSKNADPDYISNRDKLMGNNIVDADGNNKSIKSRLRKRRRQDHRNQPDQRYSDHLGGNSSKSNNIIARFVEGRSLFEATTRLVPGTELLAYFDMDSFITQSPPTGISPFNGMMMMGPNIPASAMYMNRSVSQQQNHSGIISSTSPPSAPSSTSTSTSISSSSSSSLVGGVGKGSISNNGKESERDEKGQPFQHSLFPFYPYALHHHHYYHQQQQQQQQQFMSRGGFMMNNAGEQNIKLFFPDSGSLVGGNGGDPRDEVDYVKSRMGGGLKIKDEVETVDGSEDEGGEKQGMEMGIDGPLDLTKLSKDSNSKPGLNVPDANSGLLRINAEPLKIGTPFDSPDSNDDDKSLIGKVRGDYFGNELRNASRAARTKSISSSAHLFSIRNVLKRKSSSPSPPPSSIKLFQPYSFDAEKEKEVMRWKGGNQMQMQQPQGDRDLPQMNSLFRSTPLSTPPHHNRSPLSPAGIQTSPPAVQVLRPILRTRGRERSLLPCQVCGKAFDRPSLLKRHLRTHTGEKPHVCDVCSKGFSTSSSLNTHRRIHSGEKPHQCPICGKRFTASSNLYYHKMTHKTEKPHKCMLCGKSFPTPGDLKSHQYVHSGSWPYTCPVCHRGFSKQTNLRNHLLLHSGMGSNTISNKPGEKPHTCHICDKKFALASNLRAHLKTHEAESGSAACLICKRTFLPSLNMLVNGRCQSCIYNAASTNSDGRMTIDSARSSDTASPQNVHVAQMEKVKSSFPPGMNMESAMMTHNSKLLSPMNHPIHGLGQLPPHPQQNPLPSFALPQLSTFPLSGLPGALSSLSGNTLAAPNFHFPPSSVNPPATPNSVSAAAAALFRNAAGGSPSTNPFIEHLLELNYRYAKETAGNLSLGIMQQKLLESQIFAAQLMSSQGYGMTSGSAALQDILKLRAAAAAGAEGFRQLDSVGTENKCMQR